MKFTRRQAIQAFSAGLVPAVLRGAQRSPGDKPNLLLLWTDEQRADTMTAYGQPGYRVPVLNHLAARSILFERAYVSQPICTPSRSTVMTGLWPHQNGCLHNNIPLRRSAPAIPELLADSAYRTAYMGKWHLGDEIFPQHGFQERISTEDSYIKYYSADRDKTARSDYHHFLLELGYKPDSSSNRFSRGFACHRPVEHCKPAFLAQEATRFILDNRSTPWLLSVNFLEPHMPFFGPYDALHSEAEAPIPENCGSGPVEREPRQYAGNRNRTMRIASGPLKLNNRPAWQRLNRNYAGLCAQVDQALGRILWALEASGQAGNTIIAFTSDHGDQMGAHSLVAKGVMYEEAVRVPLLLHVPFRDQKPARFTKPVSHIDLVPTLLDLLGHRQPAEGPGKSLIPVLEGRRPQENEVFCEWNAGGKGPNARAIFTADGWKLALYDTDNCLLFNRRDDPQELHNLYYRGEHRDTIRRLRTKIENWQQSVVDNQRLPEPT